MARLKNKKIILGVTGGISAYKTVEFARLLMKEEAQVQVVMTQNATQFVTPLTFEAITQKSVLQGIFEDAAAIQHIEHARLADLLIVMPATASFMARLAHGFADDLLSATCLATEAPVVLVPAMNKQMWSNLATQANRATLTQRQFQVLETAFGEQACGEFGYGRMLEPDEVLQQIIPILTPTLPLKGKKVLMTVGSTREPIDPVRYVSNASSGKMGFSLAAALLQQGASVTIICGHHEVPVPQGCETIHIETALEMRDEVLRQVKGMDIFIGAAAVADYRVKEVVDQKVKSEAEMLQLTLVKNPDILSEVAMLEEKPFTVGFALETEDLIQNARKKLGHKQLDMIVANLCGENKPFGGDCNEVFILNKCQDDILHLKKAHKEEIARGIVACLCQEYALHCGALPCFLEK